MQSRWKIYRCVLKSSLIHERGGSGKAASFRPQRRNRCSSHLWHARCVDGLNISAARRDACCSLAPRLLPVIGYQLHSCFDHMHQRVSHSCLYGWRKRRIRKTHMTWKGSASDTMLSNLMHPLNAKNILDAIPHTVILVGSMHYSLIHLRF